jgi:hypothetical protein
MEDLKDLIFVMNEIDPCEFAKIINKINIIVFPSNRCGCRTSHIGMNKFQRDHGHTGRLGNSGRARLETQGGPTKNFLPHNT